MKERYSNHLFMYNDNVNKMQSHSVKCQENK